MASDLIKCRVCGTEKTANQFYKKSSNKSGRDSKCMECDKDKGRSYYQANKDAVLTKNKKWSQSNKERHRSLQERWNENNRAAINAQAARRRAENRESISEAARARYWANPEKERHRARVQRSSPKGCLEDRVRRVVNTSIRSGSKRGRSTFDLLGYTPDQLMDHLESLFKPGMSWENRHLWHIDHIVPLSSFFYETPDDPEFRKAWALENLQPLWAYENLSKGSRMLDDMGMPVQGGGAPAGGDDEGA